MTEILNDEDSQLRKRNLDRMHLLLDGLMAKPDAITETLIKRLHAAALEDILEPGRYRRNYVTVGANNHTPPHWAEMPIFMRAFVDYLEDGKSSTLHLSAYALWRLTWLHPFRDGNGRVSRALSHLIWCWCRGEPMTYVNGPIARLHERDVRALQTELERADGIYAWSGDPSTALRGLEALLEEWGICT